MASFPDSPLLCRGVESFEDGHELDDWAGLSGSRVWTPSFTGQGASRVHGGTGFCNKLLLASVHW